jgi:hypothetical protein
MFKVKIYELVNDVDDEVYVGSTTKSLKRRLRGHKKVARIKPNRKLYKHLNAIGWDHVSINLICEVECETKQERYQYEGIYMEQLESTLNERVAGRTGKEWAKQYYEKNKDAIAKRLNQKYTCECGGRYTHVHKARHFRTQKHQQYMATQQA